MNDEKSNEVAQELFPNKQIGKPKGNLPLTLLPPPTDEPELPPIHQEFFLPVHGFVHFFEEELDIINHPAFQRLGKVNQLGATFCVYRGASHKRLEHSLGTVHVADQICKSIAENHGQILAKKNDESNPCKLAPALSKPEIMFVRLAALLHDIGHLPSGHTLEDELCLIGKHDERPRLELVLNKKEWEGVSVEESLSDVINRRYSAIIEEASPSHSPTEILINIVGKGEGEDIQIICGLRLGVCRDIVGNTICADLLDYLYRDWYHIGKPMQPEVRIFQYFQIRTDTNESDIHKIVVSHGHKDRPKRDSISSILGLLESRYNLFESVLFHPTKCSATAMLERALMEIWDSFEKAGKSEQWFLELEERLLKTSDEEALACFLNDAATVGSTVGSDLIRSLSRRQLHKSFGVYTKSSISPDLFDRLQGQYLDAQGRAKAKGQMEVGLARKAAQKRHLALKMFEDDFGLPPGSVIMYCPPAKMSAKIQKVKILNGQSIRTLEDWDGPSNEARAIAGGHCAAQIRRFESLWRIEVFVAPEIKTKASADLSFGKALKEMIKICLIGDFGEGTIDASFEDGISRYLPHLVQVKRVDKIPLAARGAITHRKYPMGAPCWKDISGNQQ